MYKIYARKLDVLRHVHKILFIMRLTTVIMLMAIMQVSASSFAQRVTYVRDKVTLIELFKEIKKQTGHNTVWNEEKLDVNLTIRANFNDTPLEEVLHKALDNLPLGFTIQKKAIIIRDKDPGLLEKIVRRLTAIDVRGTVVDEEGNPLSGATVKVKGTNRSTQTNVQGEFFLQSVDEGAVLEFSFMGYMTQEVKASINIGIVEMIVSDAELEEVKINAGYYTVKQIEYTGNISKVTAETISLQPVNNPLQALQNRVPGMEIIQQTGVPGGGFKVQIRGRNSISATNEPLYIIDGANFPAGRFAGPNSIILGSGNPLSMINPNDIESIEVLKDADATSIYGSRGANGVVLITTKKGKVGNLQINANLMRGGASVSNKIDLLNTQEYLEMRMEAYKNDGLSPGPTHYDVNGVWDKNQYTDWQKEMIGGNAPITSAGLSLAGGAAKGTYMVSGNYYDEGTVFPSDFGVKRASILTNVNFGGKENKFTASFSGSYNNMKSNLPASDPTIDIMRAPNAPSPFDEYGHLTWYYNGTPVGTNPMAALLNTTNSGAESFIGSFTATYRLLENLTIKAYFGYNSLKRDEARKAPNAARNPDTNPPSTSRQSQFGMITNNSWTLEPQVDYFADLGKGKLTALAGMSFQETINEYRNILASNFSSDEVMDNISSATVFSVNDVSYSQYKYAALFGRVNYQLRERYFLNLTARRDASSRFGPGKQFANFSALGVAWIFSEEIFFKTYLPFLSFGKLRASYGVTGNDQISDYGFMDLYNGTGSYQGAPSIYNSRISNQDFAWERTLKSEIGLHLAFMRERLNFQLSYYHNECSNQLLGLRLPPSVGASAITANLPAKVVNSGIEFDSSFDIIRNTNWSWTSAVNFTIPKNKLTEYPNLSTSTNSTSLIIGQPLDLRRYYNTYLNDQTGLYVFEDVNGNTVRDNADLYLYRFIGQRFYGGWQNSIRFKRFDLDLLVSFTKQNGNSYLFSNGLVPGFFLAAAPLSNQSTIVLDRWQQAGDQNLYPKFTTTSAGNSNFGIAKDGIQGLSDRSFARLKNLSLSYSIKSAWLTARKIKNIQLTLQGQNLLTWTKFEGLDPENPESSALRLPVLRTWLAGLKFTF